MNRPKLTSHERELIGDRVHFRGYTPDDDVTEPVEGPSEPAGPSASAVDPKSASDST